MWDRLGKSSNQWQSLAAIVAIVGFLCSGGWWVWSQYNPGTPAGASLPPAATLTMTLDQYEERQRFLRAQIQEEMQRAPPEDRGRLQAELDAVNARLAGSEVALDEARARIVTLLGELDALQGDIGAEDIEAARAALAEGDPARADALFARIEDREREAIETVARAAYARGEIAEEEVRWSDAAAHYARAAQLDPEDWDSLSKAREFAWRTGDYAAALRHGEALVDVAEASGDEAGLATALDGHALTLKATGAYAAAEPLYRRALTIREQALGPEHPRTAASLNNLAELLKATGAYAEAEPLFRRSLDIAERTLGQEHPATGIAVGNLAGVLIEQGKTGEAEPMRRRELAIMEAAFGPEHPHVGTAANNLAALLRATGAFAEAEQLYRRALEIDLKALGPDHPDTAIDYNNLAVLLQDIGAYAEAEPLFRRALEIGERALGPEHPDVANRLHNLGMLLAATGRRSEAMPMLERSVGILVDALGRDHPATQRAEANLAAVRAQRD